MRHPAEVLFHLGRKDEATAEMTQCVEQEPNNAYFRRQLQRIQEGNAASDPQ